MSFTESSKKDDVNKDWELIAELSKSESLDIFRLEMSYLDSSESNSLSKEEFHYITYPETHLADLFKKSGIFKICEQHEIDLKSSEGSESKEEDTKKKHGAHNKKKKTATATEIRQTSTIESASNEVNHLTTLGFLPEDFKSNIIEVVLIFYCRRLGIFFKKDVEKFLDTLISLRDALTYFEQHVDFHHGYRKWFRSIFDHFAKKMPWKHFFEKYTKFLIKNNFRLNYQRAISLCTEQKNLLDEMKENPFRLFKLPWGVGVGKTALLPAIATFYWRLKMQTLYCVPRGPVRDQNAAFLYRCGIPFAYIVSGEESLWELRPSFHCSYTVLPIVYIVEPKFVHYYLRYQEYRETAESMGEKMIPPSISLPSTKARYRHLNHYNLWSAETALILDEPSETDTFLLKVLEKLPKSTFIMSATSCSLIDEHIESLYIEKHDSEVVTIDAVNVGVSTTLLAYWHPDKPILSPFSAASGREDFLSKLRLVTYSVLWRRFLSPLVMVHWIHTLRKKYPEIEMNTEFDLYTLSFNDISMRILEWAHSIASTKFHDEFYLEEFALPARPSTLPEPSVHDICEALQKDSYIFMKGCAIGTQCLEKFYELISLHSKLDAKQYVETIVTSVEKHRTSLFERYMALQKGTLSSKEEAEERQELVGDLLDSKWTYLPVPMQEIVNTSEYIAKVNPSAIVPSSLHLYYTRPMEIEESGSLTDNAVQWRLFVDVPENVPPEYIAWFWRGVGSISSTKQFYIQNIIRLESNYICFLIVNEEGAYGLNIKLSNAILVDDMLLLGSSQLMPKSVYFQIAGRVGRQSQDETGYVYLTSENLFKYLFDSSN
jgi:hypothetical protein